LIDKTGDIMTTRNSALALVTGSTAGIGFSIAQKLVEQKFEVIINGRTEERVNRAIEQLVSAGASPGQLHGIAADVTTVVGAKKITEKFPEVSVLVNNFGAFNPKSFEDSTDKDWDEMWIANVMSGVRLSRHYFPIMLKKKYGRVIFISSESALQIPSDVIHYGVSKTAQLAVARGMAELAVNTNVTVNSVIVGPTRSEGMGNLLKQISEKDHLTESQIEKWFFESVRPTSLLKRFIRTEEIGSFVAFLASEQASAITGSALRADGGVVKSVI
jgi:NAD(P)-dependent dehydrogenase (short-subunit alcohol dehydrogenase family)